MSKFIDQTGLARVLANLKASFATKTDATQSAAGLMSAADKAKLDGIEALTDVEVLAILEATA